MVKRILRRIRSVLSTQRLRLADYLAYRAFVALFHSSDVLLVGYPKSGTTWLGFLVANYLQRSDTLLTLRNFGDLVPDINNIYFAKGRHTEENFKDFDSLPAPRFFRVHAPYARQLSKVVYILRDPRAALVSYWHHNRLWKSDFNLTLKEFILQENFWPCHWDEHVAGWVLDHKPKNVLLVRYEQMHADAASVLRKVVDFAGLTNEEQHINRAVAASSFKQMQHIEDQFGIPTTPNDENERIVRRGEVDGWRDELDETSLRIIEDRYSAVMRQVGYETVT